MSRARVPYLPWERFDREYFRWRAGEHVSLLGSTGQGKTTLGMAILGRRRGVVIWSPKPRDTVIDRYTVGGLRRPTVGRPYRIIHHWPPPVSGEKFVLRPKPRSMDEAVAVRRRVFHSCAASIMHPKAGGWCVFADDAYYLCDQLGLASDLTEIWSMGRSHGVSLVAASQRPAHIPLMAYNQATHLFLWAENDQRNLQRLSELGLGDSKVIMESVTNLRDHRVLYVNTRTGLLLETGVAS